jgi:serine/threonine protein phosphatase PrpC
MQYLTQTLAKQEDDHKNQDAASADLNRKDDIFYFGVSDGAGGYGVFSGDWAQTLIDKLPAEPMQNVEAIDAWINTWCSDFIDTAEARAKSLSYLYSKFHKEGSAATLVAAWVDKAKQEIHILSYGDSFYVLQLGNDYFLPPQRSDMLDYQQNPYLLNWNQEQTPPAGFSYQVKPLVADAKVQLLACTDAVGQFALSLYQKQKDPQRLEQLLALELRHNSRLRRIVADENQTWANFWATLPNHLQTPQHFADWINTLYAAELLDIDDCTAALLSF